MAGLSEFIARLQQLAAGQVLQHVGGKLANASHAACIRGFVQKVDPYGTPWAPRKNKRGTWPLLDKTGAGIDSLNARYVGGFVRMRIKGYFRFHQTGTEVMVARKIFPESARGLGTWAEPLNTAARDGVREVVEGR